MNAVRQLVEIVVPVHDEEAVLEANVRLLLDYLRREYPFRFSIAIADNASTDATPAIAARLAHDEPEVRFCGSTARAAGWRSAPRGSRATPTSSPTWTSTSPPT
jgi:glycosyltransferase involved in cell wall biosynthesis